MTDDDNFSCFLLCVTWNFWENFSWFEIIKDGGKIWIFGSCVAARPPSIIYLTSAWPARAPADIQSFEKLTKLIPSIDFDESELLVSIIHDDACLNSNLLKG